MNSRPGQAIILLVFSLFFFASSSVILAAPRIVPRLQALFSSFRYQRPFGGAPFATAGLRPTTTFTSTVGFATKPQTAFEPILTSPSDLTMSKYASPPQAPPLFTGTKESIVEDAKQLCDKTRTLLDKLAAEIKAEDAHGATFETVLRPQIELENDSALSNRILGFYQYVSGDSELRDASSKADNVMDEFGIEMAMREDMFALVDGVYGRSGLKESKEADPDRLIDEALAKSAHLEDAESALLLEKERKSYIKNGLGLPAGEKRDRFKEIKLRLVSDCNSTVLSRVGLYRDAFC